jgi:hypothetical protein
MKLPRWLLVTLLTVSALATLAAGASRWVTWPERTLARYIDLRSTGKLADARRMVGSDGLWFDFFELSMEPTSSQPLKSNVRTLLDTVLGREDFVSANGWAFRVERGKVVEIPADFAKRAAAYAAMVDEWRVDQEGDQRE